MIEIAGSFEIEQDVFPALNISLEHHKITLRFPFRSCCHSFILWIELNRSCVTMECIFKRKVGIISIASDTDEVNPSAAKKPKTSKPKPKQSDKIEGKTLEQHRRALGNEVKSKIQVEKWCVEAKTSIQTKTSLAVFERLVVPNADSVVPALFDKTTPVVVCHVKNTQAMGEIFGHSKIKGGTRMGSWSANKADFIFFPQSGELRVWWTMQE
jgi:hypothetical protein